jgi:cardiolipin synthase
MTSGGGTGGRAAAGAIRIGNAVGAAFTNRRVLEPVEGRLMVLVGLLLLSLAVIGWFFPRGLSYPLVFILAWSALALIYRGYKLWTEQFPRKEVDHEAAAPDSAEPPVGATLKNKE